MKLILASGSKNRQTALTLAKIPFVSVPANINEKAIQDPDIRKRVVMVARAKVLKAAESHTGLILGANGVNICKGRVLEKPANKKEAIEMLEFQSGNDSSFLTGYFILNKNTKVQYEGTSETFYTFRELAHEEIANYVETEPVFQWAAAFSPGNSSAITFTEKIIGSYSNFTHSLPFEKIMPILQLEGVV